MLLQSHSSFPKRHTCSRDTTPHVVAAVLAKRGTSSDHPLVQPERTEILDAITPEAGEKNSWLDLFKDHGIRGNECFYLVLGIHSIQQLTGINIVTYYAPTFFKESLNMSQEQALFIDCLLQVWWIIASLLTGYEFLNSDGIVL